MFKKYLMSTAAFAPPGEGVDGQGDDDHELDQDQEIEGSAEADEEVREDAGDGEGADETEGSEGDEALAAEPARRPSRAQTRIQTLTSTAREAKEKADRLERELAEMRAAQRAPVQQGESPEARAARRALMSDTDLLREDLKESEARTQAMLQQQAMEVRERHDASEYAQELATSPNLKRYEAAVERMRSEAKANGQFVPRKVLLELVVGRAAIAAAKKAGGKPQQQAQRRVAAQQSRPAPARSGDTATQRGRQGDSLEKRLENVPI